MGLVLLLPAAERFDPAPSVIAPMTGVGSDMFSSEAGFAVTAHRIPRSDAPIEQERASPSTNPCVRLNQKGRLPMHRHQVIFTDTCFEEAFLFFGTVIFRIPFL